jgi:hypothetical protein
MNGLGFNLSLRTKRNRRPLVALPKNNDIVILGLQASSPAGRHPR